MQLIVRLVRENNAMLRCELMHQKISGKPTEQFHFISGVSLYTHELIWWQWWMLWIAYRFRVCHLADRLERL